MSAYARSPLARPLFEMSEEDYGIPFQMPGNSPSFFDLDSDVGLGFPTRRADNIKVQTILGNAGDLDLAKTDGPTGWGLYTLDDAIRSYQKRNDLKVDGWLRPGGPTISKMRDQFGTTLGKYPAPSPREVDAHHDRLAQGEPGLLNGTYGELKLAPIPGLPAPDNDMTGSNRSMAEYLHRHRSGLADAPDTLASYVRTMGIPGIVQARDFVGQWDRTKPGQGGDAIRAILSALGDAPELQRQFFGGPIANDRPIGIRIDDLVYRPGQDDSVAVPPPYRPGEIGSAIRLPYTPPLSRDGLLDLDYVKAFSERLEAKRAFEEQERANAVYDNGLLDANNWPPHLRARLLGDAPASDETSQNFSGNDRLQLSDAEAAEENDTKPVQIAEAQKPKPYDANQPQQPRPATRKVNNTDAHNKYFDELNARIEAMAKRLNIDPDFLHAIATHESGWYNAAAQERNSPFGYTVQPGSAAARAGQTPGKPTRFESLDRAFEVWEAKWGPQVKGAKNIDDFIERLQKGGPRPYNTENSRDNPDRKKFDDKNEPRLPYEDLIKNQYDSIPNRRGAWQTARGRQP